MKRSTLSLLLALSVFFSLNGFADDKVDCFKMNFKNGRIKKKSKKACKGKWKTSEADAITAAQEKCAKKAKSKKKWKWVEGKGKSSKGMCVKNKRIAKLKTKIDDLENQALLNNCHEKMEGDCKKIKKSFVKAYKKKCKAMFRQKEKVRRKSEFEKNFTALKDAFKLKERKGRKKKFMEECNKAASSDFVKGWFADAN